MISLSPAVLFFLLLVFGVAVAVFGKVLLHLYDARAIERHGQLAQALQREADRIKELQRRVEDLSQALPMEYVRREDWIRFSSSIDAKLDRLAELIHRNRGS